MTAKATIREAMPGSAGIASAARRFQAAKEHRTAIAVPAMPVLPVAGITALLAHVDTTAP